MSRKCVCTIWRLGEVETQQVIRFGAVLPVAHHQLASLAAAEAEVLVCVFALRPQLPLLGLQLGVPGLLLLLHHHHALEQTASRGRDIQVIRLPTGKKKKTNVRSSACRDGFEEAEVLTVGCTPRNPEQLSAPQLQDVLLLPTQWRL